MTAAGVAEMLERNDVVGEVRSGVRRFWTTREIKVLTETFPRSGLAGCLEVLPGRTAHAIYCKAGYLGLHKGTAGRGVPRKRWFSSDAIDASIRRAYQREPTKNDIMRLAHAVGRPRWWVSRRARSLGLVSPRFKAPAWTPEEDAFIDERAHQSPESLARRMKARGWKRSECAIVIRLKRLGACRADPNHYTKRGLATLMGIDDHAVSAWIEKGWLKAKRRGTARVAEQGGDQWWIRRSDVRTFVVENAAAVDLRKVDKFWFIDLLAGTA